MAEELPLYLYVQRSVALLQAHAPKDRPYDGGFSGGKDSVVIKELAKMAGVNVRWSYAQTTIDPPELVVFLRRAHPDVRWIRPKHGFLLQRALVKGFPTRRSRWCCAEYKEQAEQIPGSVTILGVRVAESTNRQKRWTSCTTFRDHAHERDSGQQKLVLPIRLWSDAHVWQFIRERKIPYCALYDEGFRRLGCVGCPLTTTKQRKIEFARWPKMEAAWRRMFERLWAAKAGTLDRNKNEWWGSRVHDNPDELWAWWLDRCPNATEWRVGKGLRVKDIHVLRDHK